jgi:hypothetical protein
VADIQIISYGASIKSVRNRHPQGVFVLDLDERMFEAGSRGPGAPEYRAAREMGTETNRAGIGVRHNPPDGGIPAGHFYFPTTSPAFFDRGIYVDLCPAHRTLSGYA